MEVLVLILIVLGFYQNKQGSYYVISKQIIS
jgi:hypothetical protein